MKRVNMLLGVVLILASVSSVSAKTTAAPKKPAIQIAILLDTSNSMDGLIDQARTQLWRIVNEFAAAKKRGVTPELDVALYEYGNNGLPAARGFIRRVLPFTTDLDRLSEELFALKTNGGEEYCGQVIGEATKSLEWSPSNDVLKVIFIAGNEPFTQGRVNFRDSCWKAMTKGISVNTIFCGAEGEGIETHWKDGADLADGRFMAIDQDAVVAAIDAPQDGEIAALGTELNTTYIAYGRGGKAGAARQNAQDANVAKNNAANVQRQVAKSQSIYSNESWDLVDAQNGSSVDLEKIDVKELPPEMQMMTLAARKAYVEQNAKKREEIQTKIRKLGEEREIYLAAQRRKLPPAANTLDAAVIAIVHDAGTKKGYTFPGLEHAGAE
jgi:hypothetical protein